MHDNRRIGDEADLRDLIDQAGALEAGSVALAAALRAAGLDCEGVDVTTELALKRAADGAGDAAFYMRRALRDLRELI